MLWLLLLFTFSAHAEDTDLCEILNLTNCSGVHKQSRRSSAQSLPSSATAAQFNPANVSHDRGFGVETMYQPGQAPSLSFVSGTGKAGAALVSSNLENVFFGNRVIELDPDYLDRREKKDQYEGKKQTLSVGGALFKNRRLSLDVGVMGKYNPPIKRVNLGVGGSLRFWRFNVGAAYYRDDVYLKFGSKVDPRTNTTYALQYSNDHYWEQFNVTNYFAGFSFKNLFLDAGVIRTKYKFTPGDANIHLYSAAYIYRKFLFNLALRHENSPLPRYKNGALLYQRKKNETYAAVQYSFNQHFIIGLHHNYYLLRELAVSATLFF